MAVPFYIPEEDESVVSSTTGADAPSASSSAQNSPTRPISIPLRNNQSSPQQSPIDSEMLVQAVYEALCRCSQGLYLKIKLNVRDHLSDVRELK